MKAVDNITEYKIYKSHSPDITNGQWVGTITVKGEDFTSISPEKWIVEEELKKFALKKINNE